MAAAAAAAAAASSSSAILTCVSNNIVLTDDADDDAPTTKTRRQLSHTTSLKRCNQTEQSTAQPLKLLFLGDSNVGKTAIARYYSSGAFGDDDNNEDSSSQHAGVALHASCYVYINQCPVRVMIWDPDGAPRYEEIAASYVRGVQGIVLVFDSARLETWQHIVSKWLVLARQRIDIRTAQPLFMVLANQTDKQPPADADAIRKYCEANECFYAECSTVASSDSRVELRRRLDYFVASCWVQHIHVMHTLTTGRDAGDSDGSEKKTPLPQTPAHTNALLLGAMGVGQYGTAKLVDIPLDGSVTTTKQRRHRRRNSNSSSEDDSNTYAVAENIGPDGEPYDHPPINCGGISSSYTICAIL
jgi:GTPase SAR1 family protein